MKTLNEFKKSNDSSLLNKSELRNIRGKGTSQTDSENTSENGANSDQRIWHYTDTGSGGGRKLKGASIRHFLSDGSVVTWRIL